MAEEITPGFNEPRSDVPMQELDALNDSISKARAEFDAMQAQAATAPDQGDARYTMHEIMGVGRFVVPHAPGWIPLLELIHDHSVDIDFSVMNYPVFDAVLDDHFDGAPLADPLHDDYESFRSLRDNIAAVRNYLMQIYYTNPPPGMTPEKARKALEQIAAYVGDGLHNNLRLFGVVPNHNPTKPFLSLSEARKPDGRGAQYIYEKILEMQRHNNWLRPFDAIVALFGGKANIDWKLPPADSTPFRDHYAGGLTAPAMSVPPTPEELAAQQKYLQQLEAQRAQLRDSATLTMMAVDMDAIGNHLLYTSDNIQSIENVSEPVRREAVDIAKDILRKLKVTIGNLNILDGLKLKPVDDLATLGAVKGVAMVYERLIAWARGIDPTIMQHPSVLAANRAIGQLGYLAKLEAFRLAKMAGNDALADKLQGQLARIPPYFSEATDRHFGMLLEKVERGIDTVINRVHEVNGPNAMVGHTPAKDISTFMSGTPVAGQAMYLSADASSNRAKNQAAIIQAQDMAERTQAQRIQMQTAERSRMAGQQYQTSARSAATGRQALQQARQQASRSPLSSTTANPAIVNPGLTVAQRAAIQRNAWLMAHAHDDEEEHLHGQSGPTNNSRLVVARIDPSILRDIRNATTTTNLTTAPVATTRAAYEAQARANAQAARTKVATEQARLEAEQAAKASNPSTKGGGRGGHSF